MGNIREALQQFQEALTLDSHDTVAMEGLGLCYYYLDEPFKALTPLKKALETDSLNHAIMNNLAFILSEIGELSEAKKFVNKALDLHDNSIIYWDTLASILFLEENYR